MSPLRPFVADWATAVPCGNGDAAEQARVEFEFKGWGHSAAADNRRRAGRHTPIYDPDHRCHNAAADNRRRAGRHTPIYDPDHRCHSAAADNRRRAGRHTPIYDPDHRCHSAAADNRRRAGRHTPIYDPDHRCHSAAADNRRRAGRHTPIYDPDHRCHNAAAVVWRRAGRHTPIYDPDHRCHNAAAVVWRRAGQVGAVRKLTASLAVAAGVALAASACADGDGDVVEIGDPRTETDQSREASTTSVGSDEGPTEESADVEALLGEGSSLLVGRSARGVMTISFPDTGGEADLELSSRFESDAQGDLSVTIEFEPGVDPEFPDGGVAEIRYAGREAYVRTAGAADASDIVESSVGADGYTSWFVIASESSGDPRLSDGMFGLACGFPQPADEASWDCDPLSAVAALLTTARGASVAGREEIREASTTKVAFRVPLAEVYPASLVEQLEETLEAGADVAGSDDFEPISEIVNEGLTAQAWLDDSGLVRKMAVDLSPVRLVVEFYDFDADIAVDAPPPEQIAGELPRYGSDGAGGSSGNGGGEPSADPEPPDPGPPPDPEPGFGPEPPLEPPEPPRALPPGCPAPAGSSERVIDFDGPHPMCIDPTASYAAVFDTSEGEMRFELNAADTPITVNNFVTLARWGYYDGTLLFRTDPSIDIIQGGSPHTNSPSDPGPGYTIPDEPAFNSDPDTGQLTGPYRYQPGQLVMARPSGRDSAGAQFFITTGPNASLLDSQGTYAVFGNTNADGLTVAQFFITTGPNASLLDSQGTYAVFGNTNADGLTVAQSIIGLHVPAASLRRPSRHHQNQQPRRPSRHHQNQQPRRPSRHHQNQQPRRPSRHHQNQPTRRPSRHHQNQQPRRPSRHHQNQPTRRPSRHHQNQQPRRPSRHHQNQQPRRPSRHHQNQPTRRPGLSSWVR